MFSIREGREGVSLYCNDVELFHEGDGQIMFHMYTGIEHISMLHGNFHITEDTGKEKAFHYAGQEIRDGNVVLTFKSGTETVTWTISEEEGNMSIRFATKNCTGNRFVLHVTAQKDEHVWGCGEQFSYFDLRNRHFPLFTQEQGVGRNKETAITQMADKNDQAGGDYYTTFYPEPTYVSSRAYFLHASSFAYADFDFTRPDEHRLCFWETPSQITIGVGQSILQTVQKLSSLLGRQATLPDWVYDGLMLGCQGGREMVDGYIRKAKAQGVDVCAVWIQDWEGVKYTSFGKRLHWDWNCDKQLYPGLEEWSATLGKEGIKVLGYINPYVLKDGPLCIEALQKGYLATNEAGQPFYVDFGEFEAGIVDFTKEDACLWYQRVIQQNLIGHGLSGWMADFGEYLPLEAKLADGKAEILHNKWPGLWAKINHDAVKASGRNDLFFFMRAGNAMNQQYCQMMWAGDQNVDWSKDDGLPSVITAALSLAMCGSGLHHSDIGGYTTLYGLHRSKELLLRWAAFCTFTPVMRSHEGNRPGDNHQICSDDDTLRQIAFWTKLHVALKPYLKHCVETNSSEGISVMRPLIFHYPEEAYMDVHDEYLLGRDLLVAPVMVEGATGRTVIIPNDQWIGLFDGKPYREGVVRVDCPLSSIPVFYRSESPFAQLFRQFQDK